MSQGIKWPKGLRKDPAARAILEHQDDVIRQLTGRIIGLEKAQSEDRDLLTLHLSESTEEAHECEIYEAAAIPAQPTIPARLCIRKIQKAETVKAVRDGNGRFAPKIA